MTHKHKFSETIIEELKPLYKLNNFRGILAFFEDYSIVMLCVFLSKFSFYFYPLAVWIIGSRQRAIASLLHEACHKTLAKNRFINKNLGEWLGGYPIFQTFETYRKSHVAGHHMFFGDLVKDPDYLNYVQCGLIDVKNFKGFYFNFFLKTLFLINVPKYINYLFVNRLGNIIYQPKELIKISTTHFLIFFVFYKTTNFWGYFLYWLLPYFTSFQIIGWLSEIAEHYPNMIVSQYNIESIRNRFPSWWEKLFIGMHGDNYHLTHHLFMAIPFWNLKHAHNILMKDEAYKRVNENMGGILSNPQGRYSVILQIKNYFEVKNKGKEYTFP